MGHSVCASVRPTRALRLVTNAMKIRSFFIREILAKDYTDGTAGRYGMRWSEGGRVAGTK